MADYWKSQPKKFCQYCKCWIADNKPSVEFHERGKNHKENVAAKISEIKKKSMDKLKQDEKNCKEFAAMEAAAMKAYEEDLKRMGLESGTAEVPTTSPSPPPSQPKSQPQPKSQHQPQPQRREKKGKRSEKDGSAVSRTQSQVWVQGKSEEGHAYYYNTLTGESKWENPEGVQGESSDSTQTGQSENSTGGGWKDAVSPEGHTYYYNTATGETKWERPADFSSADASGPGPQDESQSQPEPPGTSSPAPTPQEPEGNGQDSQQPNVAKISFRKRKADTEKEEDEQSASDNEKEDHVVEKEQEEAPNATPVPEEDMKPEEEEVKLKEGEVKAKEEQEGAHAKTEEVERKARAKKPRKTTPYGAWEQIQEEEDPYDNVDLQLPYMEGMEVIPSGLDDLPPEPKPKFRERTITSLGDEGGPASFKKTKTLNGRARSIRQRVEDD